MSGPAPEPSKTPRTKVYERLFVEDRIVPAATRLRLYVIAGSLILLGLASLLVLLWEVLHLDVVSTMDTTIQTWLNGSRTETLTPIMVALTVLFGPVVLPIVVLVVTLAWGIFGTHAWRPLLLGAGTLTGVVVVQIITRIVGRSRPPVDLMLNGPDTTFSFPSGHVLGACDFLLILTFVVFSRLSSPRMAVAAYVVAALLIVATALSRLYLGYHWASDVLASMALSLVILGTVIAVDTHRTARVTLGAPGSVP
ncbi:phosphatase PAP2 family protein [Cryobacterium algoritolerans]|uniref:Phosphatase PAP2 family protein n=1 Tax=Cryobacterium algoritolerans TaxID=1259184 RepID=A0A4R8WNM0_9MICO|nr:phosphatase PAP2 family protein [Cryobacterium algoritolerans]TFC10447.1 phosphatase PAP2 family protein [Cryobacterium algoritolerans]